MNLIELINSVVNSLSTREMAYIILLIAFLIIIFFITSTRKAAFNFLRIIFSAKKIIITFIGMTLYISLILYLLSSIELFTNSLIKNAIFWFIVGAIPLFYKAAYIKEKYKNFFRNNAIECFALPAIFSFLINFYTFNVIIELILISITIFIVLSLAVSKTNEKYKPAEKFFSAILVIIFVCLILNFTYNLFINPNGFLNINTVITFILPAILTFFLLPYIYVLALYIVYDTFYLRLRVVINDSKTYKYGFKKIFKRYNLHFFGLTAFLSEFRIHNIKNSQDIDIEMLKAEKRVNNKKSTNSTNTSSPTINTYYSEYSIFENKFVSFIKRGDLKIEDKSTDTKLDVKFYDDELVGEITSSTTTEKNIEGMITVSNANTIIGRQKTVLYSDAGAIGAYILIDDNDKGDKMIIYIDFDPAFKTAYNIIENTLMIKQNPSD